MGVVLGLELGNLVKCSAEISGLNWVHILVTGVREITLSIFYKRQPENVTRVSLEFSRNLPRSVSKSVS